MLRDAGIERSRCFLTNVVNIRPPNNAFESFCVSKLDARRLSPTYDLPPLKSGKYLHPDHVPALARLHAEVCQMSPTMAVALGGTALWALTGLAGITKWRGTVIPSTLVPGLKIIGTFHPAAILRNWTDRVIGTADLIKVARESKFREIIRPDRRVYIAETIEDARDIFLALRTAKKESVDVETERGQITCVGFAPNKDEAYVIPFWDKRRPFYNYWESHEEAEILTLLKANLEDPYIEKIFQNGLYDLQYFAKYGIRPQGLDHDTMIQHHSMYLELQKGLGFLGSLYTNEQAWKLMRPRGAKEEKGDA